MSVITRRLNNMVGSSSGSSRVKSKKAAAFACSECGWQGIKWVGQCPECQSWGTVQETAQQTRVTPITSVITPAQPIGEVDAEYAEARTTGIAEFDRVLGGGIVPGSVILMAGEPGVGKSTLLLDTAAQFARTLKTDAPHSPVLYVTAEESAAQVRMRADRISALSDNLLLVAENDLGRVLGHIEETSPSLLILDSVQTISSESIDGSPGGVSQVREVASSVIRAAKDKDIATIIVGHVTKDGSIAGPRTLEHLVDVVCQFEGERDSRLRLLRAVKNRFGPTDEVGCFDLDETGITGLADPSGLFLSRQSHPVSGTCVTVTLEGNRPLVAEIQSLVVSSNLPSPKRVTSGLDSSRLSMLIAVLQRRARLGLGNHDCYISTVGGATLREPATDLAAALAIASAAKDISLPTSIVACGEVGLAGEVRAVTGLSRRIAEASRLGFSRAIIPVSGSENITAPAGFALTRVHHVSEALQPLLSEQKKP